MIADLEGDDQRQSGRIEANEKEMRPGSGSSDHLGHDVRYGISSMDDGPRRPQGTLDKIKTFLVDKGVEERGIVPRPEDERESLSRWRYLPQFTMWAAWNTNILTVSLPRSPGHVSV